MVVTPEKVRTGWSHQETVPQLLYEKCAFPDRLFKVNGPNVDV